MIAIETNIIVRHLVDDDAAQFEAANRFFASLTPQNPGFICREVIAELVWVLERFYKLPRSTIGAAILELTSSTDLIVENDEAVTRATYRYMQGGVDFADLMILSASQASDCGELYTFDRKLAQIDGATLLGAN